MTDPATLYEAYHDCCRCGWRAGTARMLADVVGPVCESGDYLALGRTMPEPGPAISWLMTAGAMARCSPHLQHPCAGARGAGQGRSIRVVRPASTPRP